MRTRGWDEWLVIGSKAQRKKEAKKKKKKNPKKKERKERKLGLDSNVGRREFQMCEWCDWALSNRGKHEFWNVDVIHSIFKPKTMKWYNA